MARNVIFGPLDKLFTAHQKLQPPSLHNMSLSSLSSYAIVEHKALWLKEIEILA